MSDIIIISGSPSDTSKTKKVLDYLGTIVEQEGFSIKHISVRDVSKRRTIRRSI
jgi:FMN reductase